MNKILILLLVPVFVLAQERDLQRLEKYITAFASVNEFIGTILVIKDDKTIIEKSFGFADAENKLLNSAYTKFRIGSCSKQFTAIAILQLQEQGKLSVSDRLSKYFPKIIKSEDITIDMLLTHRAGVHNYDCDASFNTPALTRKKVMEIIENYPSDFPPGSKYRYSNAGYFVLAGIIEKVSGISYDEYVIKNIFRKAKMDSSGVDHNEINLPNKAKGYTYRNNKLKLAPYDNMNLAMGCGNLYSTANDLYRYYLALNDTTLLSKASLEQLFTPAPHNKIRGLTPSTGYYAYGIIADTLENHVLFTHGGAMYGFTSDITFFPDDKMLFVVLFNVESSACAWNLSKGLQAVLFDVSVMYPYRYKKAKIETKSLEELTGDYGSVKIYIKRGHLYLNDMNGPEGEIMLIPETETRFFFENENNRQLEFNLSKDHKVMDSWIITSGIKYRMVQRK